MSKKIFKLIRGKHYAIRCVPGEDEQPKAEWEEITAKDKHPFVESEDDLIQKFPNKFELYNPNAEQHPVPKDEPVDPQVNPDGFGEDKTMDFEIAEENNLAVFKGKGNVYTITKDDDTTRSLVPADVKLTNKDSVKAWIAAFLEGE